MQATFLEPYKVPMAEATATFPNVQLPAASNGTAQHHGTMVAKFASFLLAFIYKFSFLKKGYFLMNNEFNDLKKTKRWMFFLTSLFLFLLNHGKVF